MDIHPEVSLVVAGRAPDWKSLVLGSIDDWTCKNADAVVVLSEDMRATSEARGGGDEFRSFEINNFDLQNFDPVDKDARTDLGLKVADKESNHLDVLFAGNLGRFQNLEVVVRAGSWVSDQPIRITFMGDGVVTKPLKELAEKLGCTNVDSIPLQSAMVAKQWTEAVDFGLVPLCTGMYRVAYPSKTFTHLAAGCPVMAMVEPESQLARSVADAQLGYVISESTPESLSDAMRHAYEHREFWRQRRQSISEYAKEKASRDVFFLEWDRLVDSLGPRPV